MSHAHAHSRDAAAHVPGTDAGHERRVFWAMVLTGGFMVAEVAGGIVSGSLALLADAGHMLTDCASLALAWAAFRAGRRGHDPHRTYGYHRFQVLAAFVNGVTLVGIVGWIGIEAVRRLIDPVVVTADLMLAVAAVGLVVNVAAFALLYGGGRENLNVRAAALHVLGDLLGSVAAIAAALVILGTGWVPIDPILSILVALLVLRSAWFVLRRSAHILLEGTPEWLDLDALKAEVTGAVPDVLDVHHVHAWMLTSERPLMTLHASVRPGADYGGTLLAIRRLLEERYDVAHATVQIEPADICTDAAVPAGPGTTG